MTARACIHCGEPVGPCEYCTGQGITEADGALVHAASRQHPCDGGLFYAETGPAVRESIGGRSEPRPAREHVTHDVHWRAELVEEEGRVTTAVIVAYCDRCVPPWRRAVEDGYVTGQLVRVDGMHCGVTA